MSRAARRALAGIAIALLGTACGTTGHGPARFRVAEDAWRIAHASGGAPASAAGSRTAAASTGSFAPDAAPFRVGVETRVYPAGVIPGLVAERDLDVDEVLVLGLGANLTDRRDWGDHDDEDGDGFGLGVGWRTYPGGAREAWFVGGRVDLWSLDIDWRDDVAGGPDRRGSTDVLVLQPTVECGYTWLLERSRINVFAALGAELNVDTDGEDVGEGAIGLLGVSWVTRF